MMKQKYSVLPAFAAAALFLLPVPYGVATHWFEVVLLAAAVLPAVGMSLLLTLFCRPGLASGPRFAPVAAGWIVLAAADWMIVRGGSAWTLTGLVAAPLVVALTVMPAACYLVYRFERNEESVRRIITAARWPLAAVGVMALVQAFPPIGGALMFRPAGPLYPDGWRLLACHFAHFGWNHLLWDGAVIVAVGTALTLRRGELFFGRLFLGSLVWVGVGVALAGRGYDVYCGSSGVGTALVAALAVSLVRSGNGVLRPASLAALAGIIGKALFELTAGRPLFAAAGGFEPVAAAHLAGALAGVRFALPRHKLRSLRRFLIAH